MHGYLIQRLLGACLTLFGVVTLVFLFLHLIPGQQEYTILMTLYLM